MDKGAASAYCTTCGEIAGGAASPRGLRQVPGSRAAATDTEA